MKNILDSIKNFFAKIRLPSGLKPGLKRVSAGQWILWGVALVVAVGLFSVSRGIWRCWTVTRLPGTAPASCGQTDSNVPAAPVVNEQGTPVALPPTAAPAPEAAQMPTWDGASRVNILFIGLDYRDWEAGSGAPRSDTLMLFTIDPQSRTAGMLSIPRDLWVNIPGFGYSRINTAYSSGEGAQLPGGGPGLTMKTVEQVIGVPIQYFGQIDFGAFEEAIDAMGGLYICIPEKIRIDPIGNKPPSNLHPGCQTLHGYEVLAYARNRHTENGDIDRARRQQDVIMALRNQIFSPANFANILSIAPKVYKEASSGLRTNMTFDDALKLGLLLQQVPPENIKSGIIDYTMGTLDNVVLGGENASIIKPIPDKIRVLRDEIFSTSGPTSPLASGDAVALMQADGARVRVLNGSLTGGLAERAAAYFQSQGMAVTEVGNADRTYDRTVVVLYGPKLYTLRYFMNMFGINTNSQIVFQPDAASTVDIEIRLGTDAAGVIP